MKFSTQNKDAPLITEELLRESILFEDEDIVVVNKPGWFVCHPSKSGPWSSLVGATRELLGIDTIFLVGRLDRETSGVVVMAKTKAAGPAVAKGIGGKKSKEDLLRDCGGGNEGGGTGLWFCWKRPRIAGSLLNNE
jgi:23S rRNA-/tRNA-specific pseudouridylate synthase